MRIPHAFLRPVAALAVALAAGAIGWPAASHANPSPPVTRLKLPAAKNRVKGNIDKGRTIALDWAQASHVACFPGNHFDAFSGNHVLYRFDLPAGAVAKIAMKPQSPTDDLNLYAYGAGANDTMVPPNVMNTNCEASYATQLPGTKPNPGAEERVEIVGGAGPSAVYVGVAGYKGVTAGAFDMVIEIVTAAPAKAGKVAQATPIAVKPGQTKISGTIDNGVEIDLAWAQASNVACFPGTHFDAFSGKHVVYRFDMPARSTAKITLNPKGQGDLNLYAYRAAPNETMLPPDVRNTQCEASYATQVPGTKPNPGVAETVDFQAPQHPYTIYIGVAGYKGVAAGAFDLTIDLDVAAAPKAGKVAHATPIAVKAGQTKVSGKIDGGVEIDLDWAQASNVACFPGNHFDAFSGKHVVYRFDMPARSTAKITLNPKGQGDLNLYAYRAAPNETMLPPEVRNTQCEASYATQVPGTKPNPGAAETVDFQAPQHPYTIYVGVAGYKGVAAGSFDLTIDLDVAAAPKTGKVTQATPIVAKAGQTKVSGSIDDGVEIDLDWAQASNVACFPGNHFDAFSGKHVVYRFDMPARSTAKITLNPKGQGDLNLYAYRAAPNETMLPPEVRNTQCEASYATQVPGTKPNPGAAETVEFQAPQHPYTIYVGVAGYKGVAAGSFDLTIDLDVAAAPKAGKVTQATPIAVKAGQNTVNGQLDQGVEIDLDWAQASNVACFPGNHFDAFSGKHVVYRFDLPARSTAKITLKTKGSGDMNLYAYRAAPNETMLPPEVRNTQCEASYATAVPGTKPNPGAPETVEMVAIQHPYTIYVGVAGYKDVTSGAFELTIDLVTAAPEKTGRIETVQPIAVQAGQTVTVEGNLNAGVEIPLGWAESSNVACFGGHRFKHFDGHHVLYRFEQPGYTSVSVRLIPKDPALDVSLYVYRVGRSDTDQVPPNVTSARCQASYGKRDLEVSPNPGETESVQDLITVNNPFLVFIGVAGPAGVKAGDYRLEVEMKSR